MISMLIPMRIVSRVGTIIGLLVLIVGIGVLGYGTFQIWQQYLAISADRSKSFVNPLPTSLVGTLVTAVGAFLFGLSLHRGVAKADVKKPDGTTIVR